MKFVKVFKGNEPIDQKADEYAYNEWRDFPEEQAIARKGFKAGAEYILKLYESAKDARIAELEKENESLKKSFVLKDITRICKDKDEAQKTALYNLDGWRKSDEKLEKAKGYVSKLVETALKGSGVITKEELEEMREFLNDGGEE